MDPGDEWGVAVITTVGRRLKLRREAVGMRAAGFGRGVGYGEDMIYEIEGGKRVPARSSWTRRPRSWTRAVPSRRPGRT
ncbi:helix-turn-helix domain-containing protein [Streptomyces sp. NPDC057236]|uniref:helix-turn-helix domain-containing protein n=1 Tax=Streptomyces sp. NPDC057236 TaxID=3346059 RepID=UPI0036338CC9